MTDLGDLDRVRAAVRELNEWLMAGEGIDLFYYWDQTPEACKVEYRDEIEALRRFLGCKDRFEVKAQEAEE